MLQEPCMHHVLLENKLNQVCDKVNVIHDWKIQDEERQNQSDRIMAEFSKTLKDVQSCLIDLKFLMRDKYVDNATFKNCITSLEDKFEKQDNKIMELNEGQTRRREDFTKEIRRELEKSFSNLAKVGLPILVVILGLLQWGMAYALK